MNIGDYKEILKIGGKIGGKMVVLNIIQHASLPLRQLIFLTYVTSVVCLQNCCKPNKIHILISQVTSRLIKSHQVVIGGNYDKLVANWWQKSTKTHGFFLPFDLTYVSSLIELY